MPKPNASYLHGRTAWFNAWNKNNFQVNLCSTSRPLPIYMYTNTNTRMWYTVYKCVCVCVCTQVVLKCSNSESPWKSGGRNLLCRIMHSCRKMHPLFHLSWNTPHYFYWESITCMKLTFVAHSSFISIPLKAFDAGVKRTTKYKGECKIRHNIKMKLTDLWIRNIQQKETKFTFRKAGIISQSLLDCVVIVRTGTLTVTCIHNFTS